MKGIFVALSVIGVVVASVQKCRDHRFCRNQGKNICYFESVRVAWCPLKCGSCTPNGAPTEGRPSSCKATSLSTDGKDLEKFQEATADFAWSLYLQARETAQGENMIFSPTSISLALGMAMSGVEMGTGQPSRGQPAASRPRPAAGRCRTAAGRRFT